MNIVIIEEKFTSEQAVHKTQDHPKKPQKAYKKEVYSTKTKPSISKQFTEQELFQDINILRKIPSQFRCTRKKKYVEIFFTWNPDEKLC